MKDYEITLTTKDGRRITDSIRTTSYFNARRVMEQRYPGCAIWSVKEVG